MKINWSYDTNFPKMQSYPSQSITMWSARNNNVKKITGKSAEREAPELSNEQSEPVA